MNKSNNLKITLSIYMVIWVIISSKEMNNNNLKNNIWVKENISNIDASETELEKSLGITKGTMTHENYWKIDGKIGVNMVKRTRTRSNVYSNKMRNKIKKSENGNIMRQLKITHWNSGSKYWKKQN